MTNAPAHTGRGTLLSLISSLCFGAVFLFTPLSEPLPGIAIAAMRMFTGVLSLLVILRITGMSGEIDEVWRLMRGSFFRACNVVLCGAILASQLWLFAWAPANGRALQVSIGYFLLPLVLVLIGRFLYKDRLRWWHWAAVALAATGVTVEIFGAGELSWEAWWISLTYSGYFVLRRWNGHDSLGGMFFELLAMTPAALGVLIWVAYTQPELAHRPFAWVMGAVLAIVGAIALVFWVTASRMIPMSLFGLLSYVEPCLLTVASLLIGEAISPQELPAYLAIWAAVAIVLGGGIWQATQRRVTYDAPVAPPTGSIPILTDPHPEHREHLASRGGRSDVFTGSITLPPLDRSDGDHTDQRKRDR